MRTVADGIDAMCYYRQTGRATHLGVDRDDESGSVQHESSVNGPSVFVAVAIIPERVGT